MLANPKKPIHHKGKPAPGTPRRSFLKMAKTKKKSARRAGAGRLTPKGLTPYPHQLDALKFLVEGLEKNSPRYLAAEAGLGKTIVAAMLANHFKGAPIFYVCPPFLAANTESEFTKWCFDQNLFLYIIPDSMIAKKKTFDAFFKHLQETINWADPVLIIDEAHRFKNIKAKRTKALFSYMPFFFKRRIVFMSGTPIPNSRPVELWPILLSAARNIFGANFFPYGLKYCGGFRTEYGWDFSGFTNRAEFKARLQKSFMLRQKKALIDLPEKVEGLLTVGEGLPPVISKLEKKILAHFSPMDLIAGKIAAQNGAAALHLSTYLRLLGEYKLKYVLPFIESILEETKENILIFAEHKETIARLEYALQEYAPLVITGKVPKSKRTDIVKEFQENKAKRVFIGNIRACGLGFTLTKASRVIFVEFSWVDGDNSQASDRAHRIGQHQSVQVQYVVLKDSFDRTRMETVLRKRQLAI